MAVRLGADEFAVLGPVGEGEKGVVELCRRVLDCMHASVLAGDHMLKISATLGAAVAPDDADTGEQLLRRADIALYRAKSECRGSYRLFDVSYEEVLHKRSAIERDLSQALAKEQLTSSTSHSTPPMANVSSASRRSSAGIIRSGA